MKLKIRRKIYTFFIRMEGRMKLWCYGIGGDTPILIKFSKITFLYLYYLNELQRLPFMEGFELELNKFGKVGKGITCPPSPNYLSHVLWNLENLFHQPLGGEIKLRSLPSLIYTVWRLHNCVKFGVLNRRCCCQYYCNFSAIVKERIAPH